MQEITEIKKNCMVVCSNTFEFYYGVFDYIGIIKAIRSLPVHTYPKTTRKGMIKKYYAYIKWAIDENLREYDFDFINNEIKNGNWKLFKTSLTSKRLNQYNILFNVDYSY